VLANWSMDQRLISLAGGARVFVIGNSGSGKTTFARGLAERLGRPHVDLDAVAFSNQVGTRRSVAESFELLSETPGFDDRSVVEGCYADLVQALARPDDHLVWLDLPVTACVENARARPWEPNEWPSAAAQDTEAHRLH
jgi:adenylate kinase family enzyme